MFTLLKSVNEHEYLVVEIIKNIINNVDLSELNSRYNSNDVMETLHFCVENDLIFGYRTTRMASGRIVADVLGNAHVTPKGLQYIESFNGKETSVIAKNALIKAKKADTKSNIAIIAAIIALLSNLDNIHRNVTWVLNNLLELL